MQCVAVAVGFCAAWSLAAAYVHVGLGAVGSHGYARSGVARSVSGPARHQRHGSPGAARHVSIFVRRGEVSQSRRDSERQRSPALGKVRHGRSRCGSQGGAGIVLASQRWAAQSRLCEARHRSTWLDRARQFRLGPSRIVHATHGKVRLGGAVAAALGVSSQRVVCSVQARQRSQGTAWRF